MGHIWHPVSQTGFSMLHLRFTVPFSDPAPPRLARALHAVLNLDLDEEAVRLIRREIQEGLR
jgi:hypothetical protein